MHKKILVVEDEVLVGMLLSHNLEELGYTVQDVITTGEGAIAHVASDPPDAIIMDISLNGKIDGIDAAKAIKAKYDIPILFFTGYEDRKLQERAKAVQPAAIIDKLGPAEAIKEALEDIFS